MAKPYVPIFYDWLKVTEELEDDEKGRLIDAIVMFAAGMDYKERLTGAERVLFPAYKASMERAGEKSRKRAAAGAMGGEQKARNRKGEQPAEELPENPFGEPLEKPATDTLEVYCVNNLGYMSPGNFQELEHYRPDLPEEVIRHAIDDACGHGARSWAYVRKILNSYLRAGYKGLGDVLAAEEKKARNKPEQNAENPLDRTKFY